MAAEGRRLSSRPALVAGAVRRLGHRDGIGTGERVLQALIELLIERLLAFGLPLPALGAFVFRVRRQFGPVRPQRSVLVPFFHHGGSPVRPSSAAWLVNIISGPIVFSGSGRLEDDEPNPDTYVGATVSGFAIGDTIDLAGLSWHGNISATLLPNNVLHIVEGSATLDLQLDPSQDFTGTSFKLSYLQSSDPNIPSGGTRVTLVSGSISQQHVSSLFTIGAGESSDGLAVDSGGSVVVNSGGSAANVVLAASASMSLNFGALASGVFNGGGYFLVGPGGTASGVTGSGGGLLKVSAGGLIVGTHLTNNHGTDEIVLGMDSAGFVGSGGGQSVFSGGVAADTVVAAGGQQIINPHGTGRDIVVQKDGSVIITHGGAIVGSITAGGKLELFSGAVVSGVISFSRGGIVQIDTPAQAALNYFPTTARLGDFGVDDVIDLRLVSFDTKGSASVVSGNELKVTEHGINYLFGLQSSFVGGQLHLTSDGAGGSMVTVTPPRFILFAGTDSAGRNQLWRTDGTAAGTTEITSGTGFGGGIFSNTSPGLLQIRNEVIFNGKDANGRVGLWETDGTPSATSELTVTGGAVGDLAPSDFVPIDKGGSGNGGAIFVGDDNHGNVNLWVTNGTSKGTSELTVAGAPPGGLSPRDLAPAGNKVVFTGFDSHFTDRMWVTDGTNVGTKEISAPGLSNPHNYVTMQVAGFEKTFFNGTATVGLQVPNLWVTNLTAAGTSEFSVPGQSSAGLDPQDFTLGDLALIAKYAFLNGVDANSNRNLFVTQGTQVTTSEILVPGVTALNPTNTFAFGGVVLLDGTDANGHRNLFESNGTSAGTSEITIPGIAALDPSNFAALNNSEVLFQGDGASGGRVLYRLNTVDLGAVEISVPGALSLGLQPSNITPSSAILKSFFTGAGSALWVTDATSAGTSELSIRINPIDLTVMNSEVLFNAVNGTSKHGLWVSDGTSTGTSELSVAGAGPGGLDPKNLFVVGNKALFAGTDSSGHQNLWLTDGTAGGTSELSVTGANSQGLFKNSTVPSFTLFGSEILFAGWDAARSSDVLANPGLFVA
jgi:ELWxxDGT repeat protein/autotransporter passenger strand-loop-strand repeat protein